MGAELTRLAQAADGADYVSLHSAVGASGQGLLLGLRVLRLRAR